MHHGGGARPDNPMPPPPLIQQPSVTLMQQQREAQDRIERTALYQAQHPALFHPGSQQQPGLLPRDPRELGGGSARPLAQASPQAQAAMATCVRLS